MQKFENFGNLILNPIIPSGFSVVFPNSILTEVFENGSFNLHNYMNSTGCFDKTNLIFYYGIVVYKFFM